MNCSDFYPAICTFALIITYAFCVLPRIQPFSLLFPLIFPLLCLYSISLFPSLPICSVFLHIFNPLYFPLNFFLSPSLFSFILIFILSLFVFPGFMKLFLFVLFDIIASWFTTLYLSFFSLVFMFFSRLSLSKLISLLLSSLLLISALSNFLDFASLFPFPGLPFHCFISKAAYLSVFIHIPA